MGDGQKPVHSVEVGYTNYRGEYSMRHIRPEQVWYGSTEWHPERQWFLRAIDVDKSAVRDFALKDIGTRAAPADLVSHETPVSRPQAGLCEPNVSQGPEVQKPVAWQVLDERTGQWRMMDDFIAKGWKHAPSATCRPLYPHPRPPTAGCWS